MRKEEKRKVKIGIEEWYSWQGYINVERMKQLQVKNLKTLYL